MSNLELEQMIHSYCERNHIFGALRITQKDQILIETSMGYADAASKTPFSKHSMFSFYSLSKPFCALGIMKLKDQGMVDVDAHPSRYLPCAARFDSRVTIRDLLHHVSGIPDFEQSEAFGEAYDLPHIREQVARLSSLPSVFAPKERAMYANVNYLLPALIIEEVTTLPYATYMQEEVFRPLGMPHALVDYPGMSILDRVQGYELRENAPAPVAKSYDFMLGAGDIVGTIDDVYRLNHAIKHCLLLSERSWKEILTPAPQNSMGLGCTLHVWHGKKRITHNGGHTGFRTLHVQLIEEDLDIIFLSNSGYGNAREDILNMLYNALYDPHALPERPIPMDKGYI